MLDPEVKKKCKKDIKEEIRNLITPLFIIFVLPRLALLLFARHKVL